MKNNLTILYGDNEYLINERLAEKIKVTNIEEFNINHYDLLENTHQDALEDLMTVSFFSDEKIVVITNVEVLLKESDSVINTWVNYFKKPNPDVYVFILLKDLMPQTNEIGKVLFNNCYIEKVDNMTKEMYPSYIRNYLKTLEFQINDDAINELLNRVDYDLLHLKQELEKLTLYKFMEQQINLKDVKELVSRNLEENIYELINNLLINNNHKTIEIYYDLLSRSEDPIRIMNSISNKIRQLIHTKLLIKQGYSQEEVKDHFNISSGQSYYLIKDANSQNLDLLEDMLKRLSKLDYNIKVGKVDKTVGLEMFILGA